MVVELTNEGPILFDTVLSDWDDRVREIRTMMERYGTENPSPFDTVISNWDDNMRAIGRMLLERYSAAVWCDVFRVYVEQQGLRYDAGDEITFLNGV